MNFTCGIFFISQYNGKSSTRQDFLYTLQAWQLIAKAQPRHFVIPCKIIISNDIELADVYQLQLFMPRLKKVKVKTPIQLMQALIDILLMVDFLHTNGWVHRDIDWQNILQDPTTRQCFLIDFDDARPDTSNAAQGDDLARVGFLTRKYRKFCTEPLMEWAENLIITDHEKQPTTLTARNASEMIFKILNDFKIRNRLS